MHHFQVKKRHLIGLSFWKKPKTYFGGVLGISPQNKNFPEKLGLVSVSPLSFVTSPKISEKILGTVFEKN